MPEVDETAVEPAPLEPFEALVQRAEAAGIETEVRVLQPATSGRPRQYVIVQLPNGRRTHRVTVFPRRIDEFLASEFEQFVALGDYIAVVHKGSGRIEAQVTGAGPVGRVSVGRYLRDLPGVEIVPGGGGEPEEDAFDEEATSRSDMSANWRLLVEKDGVSLEISPVSSDFSVIFDRGVSIKIGGISTSNHDSALEALERYGAAMLFELDVVFGISVQLATHRRANRPRRHERPDHPPKFPRNQYAGQALELYQYGRGAAGLPLLEYLAYYQSVEYFFPFFAREQTVNSVRGQLLHPGFDATSDAALNRLINLAAPAGRGGMAEREQLRATLRACTDEAEIREFIESLPEYTEHFCSKNQSVKGVGVIHLAGQADIRDQIADRIYAIRCRIVHAKQDGGGANEEVLLPSSAEAGSLQADVELLRVIAQKALVARAARA